MGPNGRVMAFFDSSEENFSDLTKWGSPVATIMTLAV